MTILFSESVLIIQTAVNFCNSLLRNPSFYLAIEEHTSFDLSDAPPRIIANLMKESNLEFIVKTFTPSGIDIFRYRKTFAFTDSRYPRMLFLNTRKLDREVEEIAATIIHESIHALDDKVIAYEFGHGDNRPHGKENTAPYWIGNLAYKILKNNPDISYLTFNDIEEFSSFSHY